ncbi:MAG: outer membrane protein transport protein [Burkholderiales bacterium]
MTSAWRGSVRSGAEECKAWRARSWRALALGLLVLATGLPPVALASGFFINQQSVRGLGRVNAGVAAAADDPSTMFFNAANLAYLWCGDGAPPAGTRVLPCNPAPRSDADWASFGVQLIIPRSDLTNSTSVAATPGTLGNPLPFAGSNFSNPTDPTPVPNLYWAHRFAGGDGYVGLAMGSPFGLAATYSDDWFGRYDSIEASLTTVNVSMVAAYRVTPAITIGGGLDVQYAKTKLVTAIPNPFTPGGPTAATDGRITIEGTAWTPGFNVGVMFAPDAATRVGLAFRSQMNHDVSGTATTANLTGPLAPANGEVGASAKLKLPAIASIGVVRQATEQVTLYAQYEWYGWSNFNEVRVSFDNGQPDAVRVANYRDSFAVSAGLDYAWSDALTLRGGLRYDRTPTVDGYRDTTFPDSDRYWLGLGASYRLSKAWSMDVAFNQVWFPNADIDVTRGFFDGTPLASAVRTLGTAELRVNTVSVNFAYSF